MSDVVRSVSVRLSANTTQYLAAMKGAGAETAAVSRGMTSEVEKSSAAQQRAWRATAVAAKLATGAIVVGIGAVIKESADFGAKMALVRTLSHDTARQQDLLAKSALNVGQKYGFTATQVSDAEAELIKAGVSVHDILGGALVGALTAASAGQTDVATATEIAAAAMTQFKLKGKDVPHIADLLASGADKALGSVTDLGYALSHAGLTAHQMGLSVEDTVGTLTAFAQAGLQGERAGTTLQQVLLRLAGATGAHLKLMDKYGISLYKANGQIKTMPELADNLQKSLGHLDARQRNFVLTQLFGQRAIQGANILYAEGAKGIQGWINKVNDQGFAAQQASGKLDSLSGDMTKLEAAAQTAFITLGSGAQSPLRSFVQGITSEIDRVTKNGDLQRWATEGTRDIEGLARAAAPFAKTIGHDLKVSANAARDIADAFGRLPQGVQNALVTGSLLALGANKLGLLKPLLGGLTGRSALGGGISKAAPVPVFVTNPGFGAGSGGAVAGGAAGAETTAAEAGILSRLASSKFLLRGLNLVGLAALVLHATGADKGFGSTTTGAGLGTLAAGPAGALFGGSAGALLDTFNQGNQTRDVLAEATAAVKSGNLQAAQKALHDLADEAHRLSTGGIGTNLARGIDEITGRRHDMERLATALKYVIDSSQPSSLPALLRNRPVVKPKPFPITPSAPGAEIYSTLLAPTGRPRKQLPALLPGELQPRTLADLLGIFNKAAVTAPKAQKQQVDQVAAAVTTFTQKWNDFVNHAGAYGPHTTPLPGNASQSRTAIATVALGLDLTSFNSEAAKAKATARALNQLNSFATLDLNITPALRKLHAFESQFQTKAPSLLGPGGLPIIKKGYAGGGYTGDLPVTQPAGIVHGREYVFDAQATRGNERALGELHHVLRSGRRLSQGVRAGGSWSGGGGAGLSDDDITRLVSAIGELRPLVGHMTMQPHDYSEFTRQEAQLRQAAATSGGRQL